jgi:hypothetical protein
LAPSWIHRWCARGFSYCGVNSGEMGMLCLSEIVKVVCQQKPTAFSISQCQIDIKTSRVVSGATSGVMNLLELLLMRHLGLPATSASKAQIERRNRHQQVRILDNQRKAHGKPPSSRIIFGFSGGYLVANECILYAS